MMKKVLARIVPTCILFFVLAGPMPVVAQEDKDNTGTNPVNFTYDFRLITEMQSLNDPGGSQVRHTVEFRAPLGRDIANLSSKGKESPFYNMGNNLSIRFRGSYQNLSLDDPTTTPFGTNEVSGIGDFDARLLGVAYSSSKFILAPGLEVFFDTATNDFLGSGKTALAPVVFGVFPGILGGRSLFAPGYQYIFDVSGDNARADISRSQIDLYFVWILASGKNWLTIDPQIILDHENDKEFSITDVEWGFMMVPKYGVSAYLRPGWGIGSDRPFGWNLEVGLKFIWQ